MFLYNKYRPKNISEFFGHKNIIKSIKFLKQKPKIPNCFLFYGPKGTGKTSFSRIFFKFLNCKQKTTNCNCKRCKKNINKNDDYIEIDAASNRKVEEILNLFANINYLPINGNYKVYSIDESQMLSNYSFNFLLKKIECMPAHAFIFFLTTQKKKIPDTIISRCFLLNFKKFNSYEIYLYIKKICIKENIKISKKALTVIATNSNGSLRDGLVLLEQAAILFKNKIKSKYIYKITNNINESLIFNFFIIVIKNPNKIIKLILFLYYKKINITKFLKKIVEYSNKILFYVNNKKYVNFIFNNYKKKYIKALFVYETQIALIRKIILEELDCLLQIDDKISCIKYIFYLINKQIT
ncbi:DNA polymerase III subunit gamma/tau [Candidatus Vidania fulgoroideorum]